jgi:glycosyltransferase 2 family protein
MRRLLKVLVAVVLLVALAYGVDWAALPKYFEQLSWPVAVLSFVALSLQYAVSAWKWQWALRLHGLEYRFPYLLKGIGIGFFFNHFLPSAIGGDAYRVMKTMPSEGFASRALSAVIVERIVGFAALLLIAFFAAFDLASESETARTMIKFAGITLAGVAFVAWAVHRGWHEPLIERVRHTRLFAPVDHNIGHLRSGGASWIPLIVISLLFQAIAIGITYGFFWSLGASVAYSTCAVIMAAAGVATILPISINGLGVVEGAFVGSALALGVPYEPALIVAVLLRLLLVPYAILFGVIYAFEPARGPEGRSAFGFRLPAEDPEREVRRYSQPSSRTPKPESRMPRKDPARRA